jgi:hypothetical protein
MGASPVATPDTHLQGWSDIGEEFRDCLDEGKPGANGAFRIMLMRLGVNEIS